MKRSELTTQMMKERGFKAVNEWESLKDIVFNIQENTDYWKFFRMTEEEDTRYTEMSYGMCSTYKVFYKKEYLEVSADKKTWYKVAYRYVETNRVCTYAD